MTGASDPELPEDVERQILALEPQHWEEARARVAALRAYLALPAPRRADANAIAASIGTSQSRFYELLRRWRDTDSVAVLVPQASRSERRSDRISPDLVDLIVSVTDEVLDQNPGANADTVWHEVRRRCEAMNRMPPSRVTVRRRAGRHLMQREGNRLCETAPVHLPSEQVIQIDRVVIAVPTRSTTEEVGFPALGLAIDQSSGVIVAHRVAFEEPFERTVAGLFHDLLEDGLLWTPDSPLGLPVQFDRGSEGVWADLEKILARHSIDAKAFRNSAPGNGRRIRKLLSARIGAVPIATQAVTDGADDRLRRHGTRDRLKVSPVQLNDIYKAVDIAVAAYNRGRASAVKRGRDVQSSLRPALLDLADIAGSTVIAR